MKTQQAMRASTPRMWYSQVRKLEVVSNSIINNLIEERAEIFVSAFSQKG